MQQIDPSNTMFTLAADLVNQTARHIFLTGKAGTGKTTFLKYIKENCLKQMAVVAPTGVAAINAGGVTIHSFFQLPFAPFIPEAGPGRLNTEEATNKHSLLGKLRLNSERKRILQELELLVIDEISMVRCDVLDAIDTILRYVRGRSAERFGGVQVLFIGDMFQLPPVVKDQEWSLLREYYSSPYFFDSRVMKVDPPVYIEFEKIYRQTEEKFINLLNKVRNNEMDESALEELHERYQPDFFVDDSDGFILLTTHNEKASNINARALTGLGGEMYSYNAEVEGEFPPSAFPADENLQLKVGARVMFIKNDLEKARRYYNGKIGVVTRLTADKIFVQCKNEPDTIEVGKEKWENIRYTLNRTSRQLDEDVLGSFTQFPLRHAWAITIHKSQGLTFEKAVIDAGQAFAPGQVYVALSRCTNLDGMVLHSRIRQNSLYADERIVNFTKAVSPLEDLLEDLNSAREHYRHYLIQLVFDFRKISNAVNDLEIYLREQQKSFNSESLPWIIDVSKQVDILQKTSEKFLNQLQQFYSDNTKGKSFVEDRMSAAGKWFSSETRSLIERLLKTPVVTDSRVSSKEFNDLAKEIFVQLSLKLHLLEEIGNDFDIARFHQRKNNFICPPFKVNAYAAVAETKIVLEHPELYHELKRMRDTICSRKDLPIYMVANGSTLEDMTTYLPQTLAELERISGFGKIKVNNYGKQFLTIINDYCEKNDLSSRISEMAGRATQREKRSPARSDTKLESFKLYKEGQTIANIAKSRGLTSQTIEGHLAHFVKNGDLEVEEMVEISKISIIENALKDFTTGSLTTVKEKLGNNFSYGEIRLVLAAIEKRKLPAHKDH